MRVIKSKEFEMGMQLVTAKVCAEMETPEFMFDVAMALERFSRKDWGNMCDEDKKINEEALLTGDRLMGSYDTCKGKIWIITESDRSATTVLFPDEY